MISRRMFTAGLLAASSFGSAIAANVTYPRLIDGRYARRGGILQFKHYPPPERDQYSLATTSTAKSAAPVGALQFKGGATISAITYKIVFVGNLWSLDNWYPVIDYINSRVGAAASNATLNSVFGQYFTSGTAISATARRPMIYPTTWRSEIGESDLRSMVDSLAKSDHDFPAADDLPNFAYLFVLPPGTILDGPTTLKDPQNSLEGLGGYHDWYLMPHGTTVSRVYFGVVAWADGQNGSAIPSWNPRDNVCAGLYHELAEIRLNPNVDDADEKKWGWLRPSDGAEIGNLVISYYFPRVWQAFTVWTSGGTTLPIQKLWANCGGSDGAGLPWNPGPTPPSCKCSCDP